MHDVYVYYKQVHTDGNYFGGITFHCSLGSIEPGQQWQPPPGTAARMIAQS